MSYFQSIINLIASFFSNNFFSAEFVEFPFRVAIVAIPFLLLAMIFREGLR